MTENTTGELGSADILEIMKLLPHRYPFLLVDKIIEIDGDNSAIGIKNCTASEPHFTGHFPESPIMPGVLLIEGMAQTAGAICARKEGQGGNLVYFMTIDNARFRKPVVPGDRVEYHVTKQKQRGNIWKFHCDAKVDGALVAEADIGAMIVRKEKAKDSARETA
nr:3-hydroxyacyl-ACP dehydratase FabZ [uncultured Gellertiella sp.]